MPPAARSPWTPTARRALAALALLVALPAGAAGGGAVDRLIDRALADSTAWKLLNSLTVEVGPRFAGTAGDREAVDWALARMRRLGLANVRAEPVTVPRWRRGEAAGAIVEPFAHELALTALGGSVGTGPEGIVAEVVRVASLAALDELAAAAVAGKIVFFDAAMERRRDGADYGRTVGVRTDGPSRAAARGAVAVLIRSLATGTHRFPHTGALDYEEGTPRIPAAALAVPDANVLAAQLDRGQPVFVRLELTSRDDGEARSANVIGEVPGGELAAEIVLLGAHLDSWDLGHGAIDDGAGCATVLAAAALLAELPRPPRRTVRVVLFANEEFGLSGAKAYAAAHAAELARHQLAVESDFGAGRVWRFATAIAPAALPAAEELARRLARLGVEWHGNTARGGADLSPLRPLRVPRADLTQDGTHYFDYHHSDDDTLDKVDPEALAQNVAAYAAVALWAAETPQPLAPAPEPEPEPEPEGP